MSATTSPDGLVYPNDPNAPADVINDMRLLANSVQATFNAHMNVDLLHGFVSMSTGWVAGATGYGPPCGDKTGRLVVGRGLFVRTSDLTVTDNTAIDLGQLPAGYEPIQTLRAHATWVGTNVSNLANASVAGLTIWGSGLIQFTPTYDGKIKTGQWISLAGLAWVTP